MVKFMQLIGLFLIYLSAYGQKAFFYQNSALDLNKYSYFLIENSTFEVHDITNPFINIMNIKDNENKYFILYNEVSLKNFTIIDGESGYMTILMNIYEGSSFNDSILMPKDYKKKKLKGNHLILDMTDGGSKSLIWRGWIDLKKIRAKDKYTLYQRAISLILLNFSIEPAIIE